MPLRSPALVVIPLVLVAGLLSACSAPAEPDSWYTPGALPAASSSSPTPTASAAADVAVAAPPAAAAAPAPATASVDYVGPVTKRWGACFARLGIGDVYYDDSRGVVTAAWNGGVITWTVSAGEKSGTPADQESVDAFAGC